MLHAIVYNVAKPGDPQGKIVVTGQEIQKIDLQIEKTVTRNNFRNVQAVVPGAGVRNERAHFRQQAKAKAGIRNCFLGVIVKAQADAVTASGDQLRLAVHPQEGNSRVADGSRSVWSV